MSIPMAFPIAMLLIVPPALASQPKSQQNTKIQAIKKPSKAMIQALTDDAMDYITLNYDYKPELVISITEWQENANIGHFPKGTNIKLELAKIVFGPQATVELFDEKILEMKKSMEFLKGKPSKHR